MELRVVGVLVILYAVVSDDVGDWAAVDCKQQRAKHRPLRDAHVDFSGVLFVLAHLNELGPAFEIGLQPAERYFRHSDLELQAIEEEPVVDGVEGCRQVEADQDSDLLVCYADFSFYISFC